MNIGHIMTILDRGKAQFVGRPVNDSSLDAAAGHPHRESVGMVVAAVGPLVPGVRPNSVAHTTSVSSSIPRCLRSLIKAAIG